MELPVEKIETAPLEFCEAYQKFFTENTNAHTQAQIKLIKAKDEINNLCNKCIKNLDTFRQGELKKLELLQGWDFCCNFSKFY